MEMDPTWNRGGVVSMEISEVSIPIKQEVSCNWNLKWWMCVND